MIQILVLLGMYFDAVVVEVEKSLLFFRLALAILRVDVGVKSGGEAKIHLEIQTEQLRCLMLC